MVAYEFYWRDETDRIHLIGILPERRKNPERITEESILNWVRQVRQVTGNDAYSNDDIYFVRVEF
jgi:hypothetical protein